MRLVDVIVGFVDPNAPDEIAQPQNPKMMASSAKRPPTTKRRRMATRTRSDRHRPDPEEAAKRFVSLAKNPSSSS